MKHKIFQIKKFKTKTKCACHLCLLLNFIFLFSLENINFYHCTVKYEIFNFRLLYFLILILIFSLFKPLLWTIRPCLNSGSEFGIRSNLNLTQYISYI